MTFGFIRSHALSPHHGLGLTEDQVTDRLTEFKDRGVLIESYRPTDDGRTLRTLELNADHPAIMACAVLPMPNFEEGRVTRGLSGVPADEGSGVPMSDGTADELRNGNGAWTASDGAPDEGPFGASLGDDRTSETAEASDETPVRVTGDATAGVADPG